MTAEQVFLREGASYFGNRLIYRSRDVGVLSGGALVLLPEGEAIYANLADITDVEVKVKAPKAKKAAVEAPEPTLDELLGE
jgi:hypothetical protein